MPKKPAPAPEQAPDGRSLRGDATRKRLLDAGTRIFARKDYAAVTTRDLADAAGANQAAILYHFGSKEGLYLAVAEHVAVQMRAALCSAITDLAEIEDRTSKRGAARALHNFLIALAQGLIGVAAHSTVVEFIAREQSRPGPAFDILYRSYIGEMHEVATTLVARATGRRADDPGAIADTHAIIGMALAFTVARATFLRRVTRAQYSAQEVRELAERVAELGCRALGLDPKARMQ